MSYDAYNISLVPAADTLQTTDSGITAVAAATAWIIQNASVHNTSTAAETLTIHMPNPDAAAATANETVIITILGDETEIISELLGRQMVSGTSLRTVTSTGLVLNLHISLKVVVNNF